MTTRASQGAEHRPLLDWLLRLYPDTPKVRAKQWINSGRVCVSGRAIRKPHERLPDPGDSLTLLGKHTTNLACGAGWRVHPRVTLLYLDSSLAVINKGAGLVSIPAPNCTISALSILADFLAGRLRARDRDAIVPPVFRQLQPLPVHRLDQFTTGVFCAALNPAARSHLIEQLRLHSMQRQYVAFVEGRSPAAAGTWRHWLHLREGDLRQHVVPPNVHKAALEEAHQAITHYEVLAEYPVNRGQRFVSKLRLRLETGLKHQIRVQAASAGLPLIGDRVYNPNYRGRMHSGPIDFPRQALHAERLELEHPAQAGRRMSWQAPMPHDLSQLETVLRRGAEPIGPDSSPERQGAGPTKSSA
jgi:23S rRNA pseudouridine1911/1915/1917 synthase